MAGFGLVICLIVVLVCAGHDPCVAETVGGRPDVQNGSGRARPPGLFVRRSEPVVRIKSLTVAVWSMPTVPQASERGYRRGQPRQRWRNTFGAERRSSAWRWLGPAGLDADIILLQGIVDVGTVRRLFGARGHVFVVSRQILVRPRKTAGVTGIVIRRRPGLAITSVQHIWWRPHRYPIPPGDAVDVLPAAITAVRLRAGDRQFWVASIAAGPGCAQGGLQQDQAVYDPGDVAAAFRCQGLWRLRNYFALWRDGLTDQDGPVILAGTGAADDLVAKGNLNTRRLANVPDRCGVRTPQLLLLDLGNDGREGDPTQIRSSAQQPTLGPARGATKRQCALLVDINLHQQ